MAVAMTYSKAVKAVESGKTPICLFLYGSEDYLKEDIIKRAAAKLVPPAARSLNLAVFDLSETGLPDVLAACEAFPIMAGARMVIVRNADRLSRSKRDRELLSSRLATPPASLALFLVAGEVQAKSGVLAALPASIAAVNLRTLGDRDIERWLASKARAMGLSLSRRAAGLLLDLTERSMWSLANELEKLAANAGGEGEISEKDVLSLVSGSTEMPPFALADAVRRGDRKAAAAAALSLLERGEPPVKLTAMLGAQTMRAWAGAADRARRSAELSRSYRKRALILCEADSSLKRSKISPSLTTQLLADALTRRRR